MRKYHPRVGSILRIEYGIELVAGLQQYAETAPYAPAFEALNMALLTQHRARRELREPLLLARARLRFADLRTDRVIRQAFCAAKLADGGRRHAGPITAALFPRGLKPVVVAKGRAQLQPTKDLITRLTLARVGGIDDYRAEWLPKLKAARQDLEGVIAAYDAATEAHDQAFLLEKALREEHYVEIERIMGRVRTAFPRDRELQDSIFPEMEEERARNEPSESTEPPVSA
jgi:hypothetical protein